MVANKEWLATPDQIGKTKAVMERLVGAQQRYDQGQTVPLAPGETFSWYRKSGLFKRLYGQMINAYCVPLTDEELMRTDNHAIGKMFEDISGRVFAERIRRGDSRLFPATTTVLSPKRTAKILGTAYNDHETIGFKFGLSRSNSIASPDYLTVEEVNGSRVITSFVEASMHKKDGYVDDKLDSFYKAKDNLVKIGLMTESAKLVFLVPGKSYLISEEFNDDVVFHQMPFGYNRFVYEFHSILDTYRTHGILPNGEIGEDASATLVEMQQRAREKGTDGVWDLRHLVMSLELQSHR